ncbi:MAG TPA: hypothetical protein VIG37_19905, partial [Methylomirabilota bacterium]
MMIGRRRLLLGAAAALAAPDGARGQPATRKVRRIGLLGSTSPKVHGPFVDAFREALRARGYVEGKSVVMEYRWAE